MRRQFLILISLTTISVFTWGQNCSCISRTKDKKTGIETVGGLTNSRDFYSLLIQKKMSSENDSAAPTYFLSLVAASRVLLTDSMLKTKGTIVLKLTDNSLTTIDNVTYMNDPMGLKGSLGFQCEVREDVIQTLSQNPIVLFTVEGILKTFFVPKKQKEQQKIYTCLLNRKPKEK
jgi:hypothetical protein